MRGCARVCVGVGGCRRLWAVVWDEFSEFLPENRVPTSADFNTYPIRIFVIPACTYIQMNSEIHCWVEIFEI